MSAFDLTLAFGFITLAACLIYALAARGPEVPNRVRPERAEPYRHAIPRKHRAPSYLTDEIARAVRPAPGPKPKEKPLR